MRRYNLSDSRRQRLLQRTDTVCVLFSMFPFNVMLCRHGAECRCDGVNWARIVAAMVFESEDRVDVVLSREDAKRTQ